MFLEYDQLDDDQDPVSQLVNRVNICECVKHAPLVFDFLRVVVAQLDKATFGELSGLNEVVGL
jgi:hypothetical protein